MTANRLRGEVAFALGGRTLTLRPSFQAIVAIEERLGGLIDLARRTAEGRFGLKEAAVILWETLDRSRHPDLTETDIGNMILEYGLASTARPVAQILASALNGLARPASEGEA